MSIEAVDERADPHAGDPDLDPDGLNQQADLEEWRNETHAGVLTETEDGTVSLPIDSD